MKANIIILALLLLLPAPSLPPVSNTYLPHIFLIPSKFDKMHSFDYKGATVWVNPPNAELTGYYIENTGDTPVRNPRIIINGDKIPYSTDELLEILLQGDGLPEDRLFENFIRLRYHWYPATVLGTFQQDPFTFFAALGYGNCGDAAIVFRKLAQLAGIAPACEVYLYGHVVNEIRNKIYDPDSGVKYDYSLEELQSNPEFIWEEKSLLSSQQLSFNPSQLAALYMSSENNEKICDFEPVEKRNKELYLQPGDRIEFYYNGYYFDKVPSSAYPEPYCSSEFPPPVFGVARLISKKPALRLPYPLIGVDKSPDKSFESYMQINPYIMPFAKAGKNSIEYEGGGRVRITLRFFETEM